MLGTMVERSLVDADDTAGSDGGEALLLVEDDRELAALLVRLFTENGYLVAAVRDVQGGLHRALTDRFSVLDRKSIHFVRLIIQASANLQVRKDPNPHGW